LERVGFQASPRFLGVDEEGRDIVEFVHGEVPSQPVVEAWAATASVLSAVALLLRRLHVASGSFVVPADACWFGDDLTVELPAELPPAPEPEIVSHFDVTPQNVVFRAGEPVALIDFDLTRPGTRLQDVINTAMWWVPLFPPEDRDPAMAVGDVPSRLKIFVESYGLGSEERTAFVGLAVEGATRAWYRMKANAEHRGGGWARMWNDGIGNRILRRHEWLLENQAILNRALT
jgi:Ser/Thr protein kinase RdoA (MazF antagonist)